MENKTHVLDNETQLLISAGAAVAAGCIPCLETIVKMAREEGIAEWKLKIAVKTGQFVKDKPIEMMKAFADELLGTHLQTKAGQESLTCPGLPGAGAHQESSAGPEGCGCTQPPKDAGQVQCGQESGGCSC